MSTEELILKANMIARFEVDYERLKDLVAIIDKRTQKIEDDVAKLAKAVFEMNDEDEENDESALEKVGKIAEQIPMWRDALSSIPGLALK